MKIAFVGKGGSGKTTLSALFSRYLAGLGLPVAAVDADINQHLGAALGVRPAELAAVPALGAHLTEIKELLRGDNPRIASAAQMVKTTPPGRGSRLLDLSPDNPVHRRFGHRADGVTLMLTGPFDEDDLGVACYHSKVGAVELYLNHLVDGPGEYVVVDMTAGADSFASGLFTRFDLTFLVAEPTLRGVGVYRQYVDYARDHDVRIAVVGNKVQGPEDVEFLREHVGDALAVCVEQSAFVRAMEKGRHPDLAELEDGNLKALAWMRDAVDGVSKDWAKFTRQNVEFHLRNARAWANSASGADLTAQVDPDFVLGPDALAAQRAER
ncbi:ATP-binding protein [Marinitenerispora sediminis]|uniref:ATP-binding protein n=1 Tax=Marinitenerispora sediminis TaxID=1931232 RepID=A0A368T3Z3_9ACTN|nr:ATP-binding protein [Marinitenerispora sediminis]RCV52166.1 ATP-binding protein [Marinitenerispora sediminis]RCV52831.1 ATP-binding protein [Marinitenerispora sediminis]RCV57081.1 ATP-binding protein [Marinitenerispora sediminis]